MKLVVDMCVLDAMALRIRRLDPPGESKWLADHLTSADQYTLDEWRGLWDEHVQRSERGLAGGENDPYHVYELRREDGTVLVRYVMPAGRDWSRPSLSLHDQPRGIVQWHRDEGNGFEPLDAPFSYWGVEA